MDKNESRNLENSVLENSSVNEWSQFFDESVLQMLDEPFDDLDGSRLRGDKNYQGFDNNAGRIWIYPTNLPIRNYQFNITKVALFRNTLVVLPTGLGKTFIAAVVMYNIYRWYPTGKVIFMAPTRPLVAQQVEACHKIMGIPLAETAEMTGKSNKQVRKENWQSKRVFFVTPQVVQSDINDNEQDFPFAEIKLIVVDEAHKAKGRYAYTEVVRTIVSRNSNFRVLGLSATPGHRLEDVVEVIQNLYISHIEVRCENSIDVLPYTHKRNIRTIVVPLGEELTQIRNELIDIIDPYIRNLITNGVLSGSVSNISRGWIVMEQKRYREMSISHRHPKHSEVNTDFSICISLYHALELLERHGLRVFLNFFDDSNSTEEKFFVSMNTKLKSFLHKVREKVGPNPFHVSDQTMTNGQIQNMPTNLDFGHPKFNIVKTHITNHFQKNEESKVIIFCEYRESVMLMHRLLLQCRPLIRPRIFVGQGGTGSIRAVTQKQQIQIMSDFRSGVSNTLIATSVAEEGIDVGEVDLIICFDISTRNPTRFVQRIGRTGRRREGNVIMMVTEGKEHALVKNVLASKDKTNQKIAKSREVMKSLFTKSPRIVPPEFNPKCVETFIQNTDSYNGDVDQKKESKLINNKSAKRKKTQKTINPEQLSGMSDVRNFFKKIDFDKSEREVFCTPKDVSFKNPNCQKMIDLDERSCDQLNVSVKEHSNDDTNQSCNNERVDKIEALLNFMLEPPGEEFSSVRNSLKSSKLCHETKKCILTSNYGYVKESFEAFEAIEIITKNEDIGAMEERAENIREEYLLIEKLLGGTDEVKKFLENPKNKPNENYENLDEKFSSIFNGLEERHFTDCVDFFIEDQLKSMDCSEHNFDSKINQNEFKEKSMVYDNNSPQKEKSVLIFEDDEVDFMNFEDDDSKYQSQWTEFKHKSKQSTPIPKSKMKTLIKHQSIKDSPVARAFAKSVKKNTNCTIDQLTNINSNNKCVNESLLEVNNSFDKCASNLFNDEFDDLLFSSTDLIPDLRNEQQAMNNNSSVMIENSKNSISSLPKPVNFDVLRARNSPEKSHKNHETSPSVLRKKPNLAKLKLEFCHNINANSSSSVNKSPLFQCISPHKKSELKNITNINNNVDLGYRDESFNETLIRGVRKMKRFISSDESEDEVLQSSQEQRKIVRRETYRKKRCIFIDDEAKDSDKNMSEEEDVLSQFIVDSIVVPDDDDDIEDHHSVDMTAKYLQSVKNPIKAVGGFKIPEKRKYMDVSNIFSQPVCDEGNSVYKEDSFVVTDDDEENNPEVELLKSCPLERAEAILKAKARAKRKGFNFANGFQQVKKRRIMTKFEGSSDDEIE